MSGSSRRSSGSRIRNGHPLIDRIVVSISDELTLRAAECSVAHSVLDTAGVPRYAQTDYPLPLAQRIRYLIAFGPAKATTD